MSVLQERIFIIDHIKIISWDMHLLKDLLSTGIQTSPFPPSDTIMFVLMNIILVSPYNTSTLKVLYSFNNIPKVLFVI